MDSLSSSIRMPLFGIGFGIVLLCGIAVPGWCAELENPTSLFPPDTVIAGRCVSIQQMIDHINAFTEAAMGFPMGGEVTNLFQQTQIFGRSSLDGIQLDRSIWAFMMVSDENPEQFVLVIPITDQKAFLEGYELDETGPNRFQGSNETGADVSIVIRDQFALYSDSDESEALVEWFKKTDLAKLASSASDETSTLRFWFVAEKMTQYLRDEVKPMLSFFMNESDEQTSPLTAGMDMLMLEFDWLLDIMDQVENVVLDLRVSSTAAVLEKQVYTKSGSPLAEFAAKSKFADIKPVLSILSDTDLASFVWNIDFSQYAVVKERVLSDLKTIGISSDSFETLWDKAEEMYTGAMSMSMTPNFESGNIMNPFAYSQLIDLKPDCDKQEVQKLLGDAMAQLAEIIPEVPGVKWVLKQEENAGAYKDVKYAKVTMSVEIDDPESELAEFYKNVKNEFYYGVANNQLLVASGNIEKAIDQALGSSDAAAPSSWIQQLAPKTMMGIRINPAGAILAAKQAMSQSDTGVNPFLMFELPGDASMEGILIHVKIDRDDMVSTLSIPVHDIAVIRKAMMGATQE